MTESFCQSIVPDADGNRVCFWIAFTDFKNSFAAIITVGNEGVIDSVRNLQNFEIFENFFEMLA